MPVSLRVPPEKEEMIRKAAAREGKTKTAFILEAIGEELGVAKSREQAVRELAGWMTHEEAEELRSSLKAFEEIHEGIGLFTRDRHFEHVEQIESIILSP